MHFFNKKSIRGKILTVLLTISVLSIIITTIISYMTVFSLRSQSEIANRNLGIEAANGSKEALEQQAIEEITILINEKAENTSNKLAKLENDASIAAQYLTKVYLSPNEFVPSVPVKGTNESTKDIYALQYSLAPNIKYEDIKDELLIIGGAKNFLSAFTAVNKNLFSVYFGTESGGLISYDTYSGYADSIYFEHRERSWYTAAKKAGKLVWSDVYKDLLSDDRGLVITCAVPVYDAASVFKGVFGMDVSLADLDNDIVQSKIGANGYVFMIDAEGNLLSSPNYEQKNMLKDENPQYVEIIKRMLKSETGSQLLNYQNQDIYLAYAPVPQTGWSICAVLPRDEIIAPAVKTGELIEKSSFEAIAKMNESIFKSMSACAFFFVIVILLVILASIPFSNLLTKPIKKLVKGVESIGGENLIYNADIKTGDEIESLSNAFSQMTINLQQYIENLAEVTADKERIGAELNVATKIQASMLPCIFPAFPEREEFDIYASMLPAKEVGGDFYDFFLIDENNLCVVMADVSGKGVPAALFMVIAKTLIKNNAQLGKSPKEVFEMVNNLLCENNEAGMFVTAFMGYLEIATGKFTYINAGHNIPLIKRSGGDYDWLPTRPGFILAAMEDMFYTTDEIMLSKGDTLFMYTDGVTEANNPEFELYSDPRLLETASIYKDCPLKEFLVSIKRDIDKFANGAMQADDITMLALTYIGREDQHE